MTVLITRPTEDSKLLAEELRKLKISSFIEPMFHVKQSNFDLQPETLNDCNGTIFTSRHAVRPLIGLENLPCFVVGEVTALEAKKNGFTNVLVAKGNVESLLNMIKGYYSTKKCRLLYLRGQIITFDIEEFLSKQNIKIEEKVVYQTDEITALSPKLVKEILAADIKTVVFFSLNTAKIFIRILEAQSLLNIFNKITCFVLSKKIQECLLLAGFSEVIVFNESTTQLIKLLQEYYKNEKTN